MRGILIFLTSMIFVWSIEAAAKDMSKYIDSWAFGATQVVHGYVVRSKVEKIINQFGEALMITRAWIQVRETLKGEPSEQVEMVLEKMSGLKEGEELVVFLQETPDGLAPRGGQESILKIMDQTQRVKNSTLTIDSIRERVRRIN